jgi:hypothetical protein
MTKRSVLTAAVAATGVAASLLALSALRIGPSEPASAQLTSASASKPVAAAAPKALAGKSDAKAIAPSQDGPAAIAKPDAVEKALPVKENAAAPSARQPSAKQPAQADSAATPAEPEAEADSCAALSKSVDVFLQHFYAAHLERSPGGQIEDILDVDQYVLTHTVMIEDMLKPQLSVDATKSVDVFLAHLYAAHLERSLQGQVADITDLDQYVLTHTVMIEDMLKPVADGELAAC